MCLMRGGTPLGQHQVMMRGADGAAAAWGVDDDFDGEWWWWEAAAGACLMA